MSIQDWVSILSVLTNVSVLVMGIKLVRHLSHIELKVDTMWNAFISKYDIRIKEG